MPKLDPGQPPARGRVRLAPVQARAQLLAPGQVQVPRSVRLRLLRQPAVNSKPRSPRLLHARTAPTRLPRGPLRSRPNLARSPVRKYPVKSVARVPHPGHGDQPPLVRLRRPDRAPARPRPVCGVPVLRAPATTRSAHRKVWANSVAGRPALGPVAATVGSVLVMDARLVPVVTSGCRVLAVPLACRAPTRR